MSKNNVVSSAVKYGCKRGLVRAGLKNNPAGAIVEAGYTTFGNINDVLDGKKSVGEATYYIAGAGAKGYASTAVATAASTAVAESALVGALSGAAAVAAPVVAGVVVAGMVSSIISSIFDW